MVLRTEGEAIVAAALIALIVMMVSQWIVWAAVLGVLLITRQSVARIEKKLDVLEKRLGGDVSPLTGAGSRPARVSGLPEPGIFQNR